MNRIIQYYSGIKRYIASRISISKDAEDLTQSVFLEFHKSNYNGENPEPYLFGIARTLIANYYRQKGRQPEILRLDIKITDGMAFKDYAGNTKIRMLAEEIETLVSELPPKAKEAVELRLIHNLNSKQASSKANCSVEIFYGRFYEGLKIIKKSFAPKTLKKKELSKKCRKT